MKLKILKPQTIKILFWRFFIRGTLLINSKMGAHIRRVFIPFFEKFSRLDPVLSLPHRLSRSTATSCVWWLPPDGRVVIPVLKSGSRMSGFELMAAKLERVNEPNFNCHF